jgi:hypothetical protein
VSILTRLASSLGRRDEVPNQQLAEALASKRDRAAIAELVAALQGANRNIQSDAIKVLYEIGARQPALIAKYCDIFSDLLTHKNNRLAWGAMTALDAIARADPAAVHALLKKIIAAADTGSVITRDHAVGILVKLAADKRYARACWPLLLDQLDRCPNNQLPMYAEMVLLIAHPPRAAEFERLLLRRRPRLEKDSQKRRITKVLKALSRDARPAPRNA